LGRTPVQRHLRRLLARAGGIAEDAVDLTVYPWLYYVPGLLYAEHGHQYHDLNSFPALVRDDTALSDRPAPPLGAAIDRLVLRVTHEIGSDIEDPDSLSGVMHSGVVGEAVDAGCHDRLRLDLAQDPFAELRGRLGEDGRDLGVGLDQVVEGDLAGGAVEAAGVLRAALVEEDGAEAEKQRGREQRSRQDRKSHEGPSPLRFVMAR
jgi:hypothetical protein